MGFAEPVPVEEQGQHGKQCVQGVRRVVDRQLLADDGVRHRGGGHPVLPGDPPVGHMPVPVQHVQRGIQPFLRPAGKIQGRIAVSA